MKARIKETGEIIEFTELMQLSKDNRKMYLKPENLEFLDLPKAEPDYWEKLKHQYVGMAMQGMLSNCEFPAYSTEGYYKHNIANNALEYATTLINKLKEESQCEK